MFGEEGTPQLTDFGIARAMSEGTRMTATGMSIGSPHYMSPEQARGLAVDGRSDLYSLGVVLYEMLTGRLPFDAGDTLAVAYAHVNDPVPELPSTLARWEPVVRRLLAKSPEDRYGSPGELAAVLVAEGLPRAPAKRVTPVRHEVGPTTQSKEASTRLIAVPKPRRGLPAALAGALLALTVVGIGYVALRDSNAPQPRPTVGGGGGGQVRPAPQSVLGGSAVLVVESRPTGAEVLVDGRALGKTPLERSDIRAGVRDITLRHPYYETVRETGRRFDDGRVVRVHRELVRGRGALAVTARPRQAWVEVDGKRVPEGTPVTLEDLPAGRAKVRLGAAEHRPMVVEVDIPKDGVTRLERTLQRIPYGSLTLELEPPKATVTLPKVGLRYRPGVRLPEGAHQVVVRREGYREVIRTVYVSGATQIRIELEPKRLRAGESREFDGIKFVWVPAGEFQMGSTSRHADRNERTLTRVSISRGFWLGKYEVTQAQWQAVMGKNPSRFKSCGDNCPVERVSWNDAQLFIGRLNTRTGGEAYRLPTEAEWEYAARGSTKTDTPAGDLRIQGKNNAPRLDGIAWYGGNSGVSYAGGYDCSSWDETQHRAERCGPHPVGEKVANAFALHDMLGNVWEWVEDRYGRYRGGAVTDPTGPRSGSSRVNRGGSWGSLARKCRSAVRSRNPSSDRYDYLGFRLVRKE